MPAFIDHRAVGLPPRPSVYPIFQSHQLTILTKPVSRFNFLSVFTEAKIIASNICLCFTPHTVSRLSIKIFLFHLSLVFFFAPPKAQNTDERITAVNAIAHTRCIISINSRVYLFKLTWFFLSNNNTTTTTTSNMLAKKLTIFRRCRFRRSGSEMVHASFEVRRENGAVSVSSWLAPNDNNNRNINWWWCW